MFSCVNSQSLLLIQTPTLSKQNPSEMRPWGSQPSSNPRRRRIAYSSAPTVVTCSEADSARRWLRSQLVESHHVWNEALDSVSCMMGYHLYKNSVESKFISRIVKDVKRLLIQLPKEEQDDESHDSLSEQKIDDSSKSETLNGGSVLGEAESEALECVGGLKGLVFEEDRLESELITSIVKDIEKKIEIKERKNPSSFPFTGREDNTELPTGKGENLETYLNNHRLFGIKLRMEQLEQKLEFDCDETRIIGVVGMPGIGKTTLAMRLYEEWNSKFVHCMPLLGICKKSKDHELVWLRKTLLEVLLEGKFPEKQNEITHESVKDILLQTKIFVVLSDVSDKKQLDFLLGNLDWVKKGSKIVITTGDRSLLKEFVDDIYVVPLLNDEEAFQLFTYHAFDDQTYSPSQDFVILSRKFVDYAQGHPQALISLGTELRGKDEDYWNQRLATVTDRDNTTIQDVWKLSTDQLNERQKDVLLDIVHFFKSEDEYFVRSLLDSGDPDATDAVSEVRDLAEKFMITVSDGRVEMNDLLYKFGKGLGSTMVHGMWNYKDIYTGTDLLRCFLLNCYQGTNSMRGIFLDMSEETKNFALERMTFTNMLNLRYLKIYDSFCPRQCKSKWELNFPDGLSLPLEEIRYLHFVKFPLKELPPDFRPENLIDLRLPYSKIQRIWEDVKDTPRLKWVDLCHSSQLFDLSALPTAENLQSLNLEGCTALKELPLEIQNMKSLVFMNLRGCTGLESLPKINLISLKTLILSGCSNLKDFQLISESIEFLHLDGTAITGLPLAIQSFQRLVVLNLKNCEMLECLPNCLGELKALEELILSGCSNLKNLSDIRESMKHLQILLIDMIGGKEMPNIITSKGQASPDKFVHGPSGWPQGVNGVSSLRRLSLNGNDFVSLQTDIWKLYNLNCLDVKNCKMLRSIPMLPPRLQYFDAQGCDSLETVSHPLAIPVLTQQKHATFNFSNCNKLDQDAKDSIISYISWKFQLVLDALSRYSEDSVLEALVGTCFPGCEVPAWFSHRAFGSMLESKLPLHWSDNKFTGIALCAVVLFPEFHEQRDRLVVKCNCVFNSKYGSPVRFGCTVGSWSKARNTSLRYELSHIFIGYTTMVDSNKHGLEDNEEGCSLTEASLEFQVTDGTEVVGSFKVLNCGFRLIYASNEMENTCWDSMTAVLPERIEHFQDEAKSHENFRSPDEIQYESSYDPTLGANSNFVSETKSDAEPDLWKSLESKIVDISNVENDAGKEITVSSDRDNTSSGDQTRYVGVELRLKQMEKVLYSMPGETFIVGVVGMHGIGKTTLATMLFEKRGSKFPRHLFLTVPKECEPEQLRSMFLKKLLEHLHVNISDETTHECVKAELLQTKVFAVLDDVSDKKQLQILLGNLAWIKKGSKIVITTCDKSYLEGFAHDTYFVPPLKNREAVQLFAYHAFYKQIYPSETFLSLSRMFVDHSTGNPLALESLGSLLCGKDEACWQHELQKVRQSFNMKMGKVWRFSIKQLTEGQKDMFLDIVYFFKSEEEYFVRRLLDSENPEAVSEVRDLADKLLITISGGRVGIHDQLYALSKDLGSPGERKLWNYKDIIGYMKKSKQSGTDDVRGIFLDMSEATKNIPLERMTFINMCNLRYLKIYDSSCPRQCKSDCKLCFPDGLSFPLEEIRYLHWVKFPLEELPPDFKPGNLVDLRLPYSKIERVWEGVKDTPRLKWVDLRHSSKLRNLSALSKAENLQRLNLEGCTVLGELPAEIQNMKSLVFLNLRGCIRLWSLPKINLISLKTLILSDCSNLKNFQLISESIEFLHLDGTAITELPLAIHSLQRLVVLNLKNCEMLEFLPNCLGEVKTLEELILSGCSRLKNLSDVRESMKHLQSLLIDRIGAKEMPNITISKGQASADMFVHGPSGWPQGVNGVFSLRRLSLSGNDFVSLQTDIWELYNLNWLDLKDCKMLRSIPMLPPRLQYFDAHGCDSLERVSHPLALPVRLEQIHATFNFSNCSKLDQDAKDSILSYTRWKSELVLDALSLYNNGDSALENFTGACFPGWEVPARFSHQASGPVLEGKLSTHWRDNNLTGIALCAVILFPDYHEQRARLVVNCNCEFNNEDGSYNRFSCTIGSWSDAGKTAGKIVPSHVFIGYASMLDNKKLGEKEDEEGCGHTKTYFKFQVTDGTEVLHGYEVLKCGFSLVYAYDELRVQSGRHEANHYRAYSKNVAISNVRSETETMDMRLDGGHDIVELPNEMIAHGTANTTQRPNNKSPVTTLKQTRRETQVRALSVRLTGKPRVYISCHGGDLCITLGECGRCFREMRKRHEDEPENVQKWETSLMSMAETTGVHSEIHGIDAALVKATVKAVHRELTKIAGGKFKSLGRGVMLSARVFIFALFAALLFSLFVSPLLFADAAFAAF
ncbi:hypothetical protein DY000_02024540, partial [Brassica cretica]